MTAVHCGGCGKRTAEALHGDADGFDLAHDDVVIVGRGDSLRRLHELAGTPITWESEAVIAIAHNDADWPLTWTCQRCGATVTLSLDQGRRVDHAGRLIAAKTLI